MGDVHPCQNRRWPPFHFTSIPKRHSLPVSSLSSNLLCSGFFHLSIEWRLNVEATATMEVPMDRSKATVCRARFHHVFRGISMPSSGGEMLIFRMELVKIVGDGPSSMFLLTG